MASEVGKEFSPLRVSCIRGYVEIAQNSVIWEVFDGRHYGRPAKQMCNALNEEPVAIGILIQGVGENEAVHFVRMRSHINFGGEPRASPTTY